MSESTLNYPEKLLITLENIVKCSECKQPLYILFYDKGKPIFYGFQIITD